MKGLGDDFTDLLVELADAEVEFMLVGGWAMAHFGHARGTDDLDAWAPTSPEKQARRAAIQADLRTSLDAALERMEQVIGRIQRFTNLDGGDVQAVDLNEVLTDVAALVAVRCSRACRPIRAAIAPGFGC